MHIGFFTFLVPMTNFCFFDWLILLVVILGIIIGGEMLFYHQRRWGYIQIFASLLLPILLYISVYSRHITENISTFTRIQRYVWQLFPHEFSYAANFPWWLFFIIVGYIAYLIFTGFSIYAIVKHYQHK